MRSLSVETALALCHRKRLEEAPLVTKAFREAQMKEKLERYPKVSSELPAPVGGHASQVLHGLGSPSIWSHSTTWSRNSQAG